MEGKEKLFFSLILILTAAVFFLVFLHHGGGPEEIKAVDNDSFDRKEEAVPGAGEKERVSAGGEERTSEERPKAREKIASRGMILAGRVVDLVTKKPVKRYRFVLFGDDMSEEGDAVVIKETVSAEDGGFSFPIAKEGKYTIAVSSSTHVHRSFDSIEIGPGRCPGDLLLELDPGGRVAGRVIERDTGKPVPGAVVVTDMLGSFPLSRDSSRKNWFFPHGVTDDSGSFEISGLPPSLSRVTLAAAHPDFVEGAAATRPGDETVEILLDRGFRVFGKVTGAGGEPVRGVVIRLDGRDLPLSRIVATGPDGKYRTAPAPLGPVTVTAEPPFGSLRALSSKEAREFDEIVKKAVIRDRDLEIDFVLSPGGLTWKGTVYDAGGRPLGGAAVEAVIPAFSGSRPRARKTVCDSEGRFALRNLEAGRYDVALHLSGWRSPVVVEPVVLEGSGEVARDLHAPGGSISGVVLHGGAMDPVPGGIVTAYRNSSGDGESSFDFGEIRADVDAKGRFALRYLLPASYSLSYRKEEGFQAKEYRYRNRLGFPEKVELQRDRNIENLRFVIRETAAVRFKGYGFAPGEAGRLRLVFTREKVQKSFSDGGAYRSDGTIAFSVKIEPGKWSLEVSLGNEGRFERTIDLAADEVYDLTVRRDQLIAEEGEVTVGGKVMRAVGGPIAGGRLRFSMIGEKGAGDSDSGLSRHRESVTDSTGAFSAEGFVPGRWKVKLSLGRTRYVLPDLVIPEGAQSPFPFDILLPAGRIRAFLIRRGTNQPSPEGEAEWSVSLVDAKSGAVMIDAQGGSGDTVELEGVPAGEFRLRVSARGFEESVTDPFDLAGGQVLDLGRIVLEEASPEGGG